VVIGMLNPFDAGNNAAMASAGRQAFALEAVPRITRAQSMDVLSSQANIAGYKAKSIIVNKRSMASGYAGLDNALFYQADTMMVFGDAKKVIEDMVKAI